MVQRYEFEIYHCNGGEVVESDDGGYVSYEDYAALKEMYDSLSEKWLDVNGKHGALCDACISYGLEPTDMIKDELAK